MAKNNVKSVLISEAILLNKCLDLIASQDKMEFDIPTGVDGKKSKDKIFVLRAGQKLKYVDPSEDSERKFGYYKGYLFYVLRDTVRSAYKIHFDDGSRFGTDYVFEEKANLDTYVKAGALFDACREKYKAQEEQRAIQATKERNAYRAKKAQLYLDRDIRLLESCMQR